MKDLHVITAPIKLRVLGWVSDLNEVNVNPGPGVAPVFVDGGYQPEWRNGGPYLFTALVYGMWLVVSADQQPELRPV